MDSVTQFILGASVGEAVLGRKMGNRAMLWGGIAGTIPDLDVFGNLFLPEFEALAFHRAITHSLFFAVVFPFVIAWLVHKLYDKQLYKDKWYRRTGSFVAMAFLLLIGFGFNFIFYALGDHINITALLITILLLGFLFYRLLTRYFNSDAHEVSATYRDWVWLFFWAIVTHPLLDCCTTYGTQLYQPFLDYRVAWNTVSVVDPMYTIPFLICLVIAAFYTKGHRWRSYINWIGLIWSTSYLVLGFINKETVNDAFEKALTQNEFQYNRYMTSPTLFNGILWYCVAEGDSSFMIGYYSLLDEMEEASDLVEIPKNHELIHDYEDRQAIHILKWFTDGYYYVMPTSDSTLVLNDLRFRVYRNKDDETHASAIAFEMKTTPEFEINGRRDRDENRKELFREFWERIKGY